MSADGSPGESPAGSPAGSMVEKIARVLKDEVALAPYDPRWPELAAQEAAHLRACLPGELLGRVEHFGSTAVPGLVAKPVVDLLVETPDLAAARSAFPPVLEAQGYDAFWRPTRGDDGPPWYLWFIKRDAAGARTHHIHVVEPHFEHWERLLFRDHLRAHPEVGEAYGDLKRRLAADHPGDRVAYTEGKTAFVVEVTARAKATRLQG